MRDIRTGGAGRSDAALHPGRIDRMVGNQRSLETGHSDPTYQGRSAARNFRNPFGLPEPTYVPARLSAPAPRSVRLKVK